MSVSKSISIQKGAEAPRDPRNFGQTITISTWMQGGLDRDLRFKVFFRAATPHITPLKLLILHKRNES